MLYPLKIKRHPVYSIGERPVDELSTAHTAEDQDGAVKVSSANAKRFIHARGVGEVLIAHKSLTALISWKALRCGI